jgi:phosphatidylinositol alpha 1,6-mannosyltransferase
VLVQPSRVLETYGLSLIEALASGTNVLAARRGAATEIVDMAGVGYLYEPDDAGSLANQMNAIVRDFGGATLNRFDISLFLEERSERRYVEELLRVYTCAGEPEMRTAA